MLQVIHVSSRGQIVIPEKMRKHMGIKEGSRVVIIEKDGSLVIRNEEEIKKYILEEKKKEDAGWLALAEKSLESVWDNQKDEKVWKKYL